MKFTNTSAATTTWKRSGIYWVGGKTTAEFSGYCQDWPKVYSASLQVVAAPRETLFFVEVRDSRGICDPAMFHNCTKVNGFSLLLLCWKSHRALMKLCCFTRVCDMKWPTLVYFTTLCLRRDITKIMCNWYLFSTKAVWVLVRSQSLVSSLLFFFYQLRT